MPERESLPVRIRLVIEVDGHTLTYEETGKATGGRYHGGPVSRGFDSSVLEREVRGTADTCIARATKRATETLRRLYPLQHDDVRVYVDPPPR